MKRFNKLLASCVLLSALAALPLGAGGTTASDTKHAQRAPMKWETDPAHEGQVGGGDRVATPNRARPHARFPLQGAGREEGRAALRPQDEAEPVHQSSGKVLVVPSTAKLGPLRNSYTPKEGRIYWMFFGNAGDLVKSGDKVTVAIGDFRAENIVVQ